MDYIIEVEMLSKKYEELYILENIDFKFAESSFYTIYGASGVGKTTLINLLSLNDKATTGIIRIQKQNTSLLSAKELAKIRNRKLGFVFQNFNLLQGLTAVQNVMLPMYINNEIEPENRKRLSIELLAELGLTGLEDKIPSSLSAGQQQRVAIARALANDPDVIIADEPTGNLDAENSVEIFRMFRRLSERGKLVIVVTHDPIGSEYCDEELIIFQRKLIHSKREGNHGKIHLI